MPTTRLASFRATPTSTSTAPRRAGCRRSSTTTTTSADRGTGCSSAAVTGSSSTATPSATSRTRSRRGACSRTARRVLDLLAFDAVDDLLDLRLQRIRHDERVALDDVRDVVAVEDELEQ